MGCSSGTVLAWRQVVRQVSSERLHVGVKTIEPALKPIKTRLLTVAPGNDLVTVGTHFGAERRALGAKRPRLGTVGVQLGADALIAHAASARRIARPTAVSVYRSTGSACGCARR